MKDLRRIRNPLHFASSEFSMYVCMLWSMELPKFLELTNCWAVFIEICSLCMKIYIIKFGQRKIFLWSHVAEICLCSLITFVSLCFGCWDAIFVANVYVLSDIFLVNRNMVVLQT